ncbi:MAG: type II toxin-antitoxin system RelE/ParE family toxin [Candidatus Latescibacteria bacterium]|nr:type II toxin-antitoxin system RelE/ParE family toxin [Candidatus Latescibacterota bacterium]MCK5527747.1 type II toxin-antitoxin system RelE/ParE family toxin [Candidatus Latescibacterota bacterium]
MPWKVTYKPRFLRELALLPEHIRTQVETFSFETVPGAENPFALRRLEKMRGYKICYKVRFGDYRLGLELDKRRQSIQFQRVLHRRDIYRYFP